MVLSISRSDLERVSSMILDRVESNFGRPKSSTRPPFGLGSGKGDGEADARTPVGPGDELEVLHERAEQNGRHGHAPRRAVERFPLVASLVQGPPVRDLYHC